MTGNKLSSGLALDKDLVFPACPENPDMRESVSLWFIEENGEFGFPRTGIEAEASNWGDRMFQANMAFADGRVLIGPGRGEVPSPIDADGRPTVIGAGPLTFQCIEPFKRWTARFDGDAADGDVRDQISGTLDPTRRTPVKFDIEMVMATPAWVQENSTVELSKLSEAERADAESMGIGYRFEHLFRATGTFEVDGVARQFKGTGLRIHRQSARPLGGFRGHCWQSCLFPSGKAFGYIAYPPREDGSVTYNEGYIYQDGRMIPARVADAPWLRRIIPSGDDVSVTLESELGLTCIEGVTGLSTFRIGNPDIGGMHLQQSGVRYSWGDESAYGMIERSDRTDLITIV
jgi:prepilin-type processing-associated H-X9-DG protein